MSFNHLVVCALALCLSMTVIGCEAPAPASSAPHAHSIPADAPPTLIQPKPKRVRDDGGLYRGQVITLGGDWFELGAGWEGRTTSGKPLDHNKPKRITTLGTRAGGDGKGEGDSLTHRLGDLRVGDVVSLETYIGPKGDEWTKVIDIQRRPGGRIPPLWDYMWDMPDKSMQLQSQAEQDWEEKGIPIPAEYLNPEGRAPWTNPPYPPVAPQPREGKQ